MDSWIKWILVENYLSLSWLTPVNSRIFIEILHQLFSPKQNFIVYLNTMFLLPSARLQFQIISKWNAWHFLLWLLYAFFSLDFLRFLRLFFLRLFLYLRINVLLFHLDFLFCWVLELFSENHVHGDLTFLIRYKICIKRRPKLSLNSFCLLIWQADRAI